MCESSTPYVLPPRGPETLTLGGGGGGVPTVDLENVDFDVCFHTGLVTLAQNTRRLRSQYSIRCTGALKTNRENSTCSDTVDGLGTFEIPLHRRMILKALLGIHCTGAWY